MPKSQPNKFLEVSAYVFILPSIDLKSCRLCYQKRLPDDIPEHQYSNFTSFNTTRTIIPCTICIQLRFLWKLMAKRFSKVHNANFLQRTVIEVRDHCRKRLSKLCHKHKCFIFFATRMNITKWILFQHFGGYLSFWFSWMTMHPAHECVWEWNCWLVKYNWLTYFVQYK